MILQNLRLMELPGSCPAFCSFISVFLLLSISLNIKMGGTAIFSFLALLLAKMAFDTFGYKMGMNPWPGVFGWYCNPAYRLFDFLLGYTGFLILEKTSLKMFFWKISIIQCAALAFYFAACRLFDRQWVPASFILLTLVLIFPLLCREVFLMIFWKSDIDASRKHQL